MEYLSYPNGTPEFRWFKKLDLTTELQVRYINKQSGYVGKWMTIRIEYEK